MDAQYELLVTFANLNPGHQEQVIWLARELAAWEERHPEPLSPDAASEN